MRARSALLSIAILSGVLAAAVHPTQAPQGKPSVDPDKTWALVIGVSNYTSDTVKPLDYAASDARAVADFLMSPRGGGLRADHVDVLLEGDATRYAVADGLEFLGKKVRQIQGASVEIYIAGHGSLSESDIPYFVPTDGKNDHLAASSVSFKVLKELVEEGLANVDVRILITDICHAGRLDPGDPPPPMQDPNSSNDYLSKIGPKTGAFLNLLASRPDESSYESKKFQQGFFTHALLDALNGIPLAPGATVADTKSVVEFVKSEVPRNTARQQNPISNSNLDPGRALAFLDRPGPRIVPSVQASLVIRNADRVPFEKVEWSDSCCKATSTQLLSKRASVDQRIGGLPVGEMEFRFSSTQNRTPHSLKVTLQPGENCWDIQSDTRCPPEGPIRVAALGSPALPRVQGPQIPVAAVSGEATLRFKAPANATIFVDGTEFTTSVAADEYTQLTGLTPGIHNLTLTLATVPREYRFRVRLLAGSQTFYLQTGEMIYAKSLPPDPALVQVPNGVPANLASAYRNFVQALWDERLIDPPNNSAWDYYLQLRDAVPAQLTVQLTQRLAIAMGDQTQQTILKYLQGGDIRWNAKAFDDAARLTSRRQQLFQSSPGSQGEIQSRQNFFAGRALVSLGRYPEAIQQLQQSVRLFPEASHSLNAIGLAYWQQGQLRQAMQPLQQAITLTPRWTYPRNILALVQLELREYDNARRSFQDALQFAPDDSSLNRGLAQLDLQMGRVADAEPRLQRAIDSNPGNAYAYETYANLEISRGNLDEAERKLRLAIRLEPDEPSFSASLADLLRQRGRIADAQQIFNPLARANPSNLGVIRPYAKFLIEQNQLMEVRTLLEQAVKTAPKDPNLRVEYGNFLRTHQSEGAAEKQYKEALKSAPSNVFAHYGLAKVYRSKGKLDQAEKSLQDAEKADSLYPPVNILRGQIRAAQKRYPEALAAFEKGLALAVEPDQQEDFKKEIEETKRAAATAAIQSAKTDIEKNRMKSAWSTYTDVLKLAPQDKELIAAILKFESDFSKDADLQKLPSSPLASALLTPFWAQQRAEEDQWKRGERPAALNSFAGAFAMLSASDRRKLVSSEFNLGNDDYGIHQIIYRWASRAIELRDFTGAQKLMEAAIGYKIFDVVPGVTVTTIDSLTIPASDPEPRNFKDFDVAHHPDAKAHEILALAYAGQGNAVKAEEFLAALSAAQQAQIRSKMQQLVR